MPRAQQKPAHVAADRHLAGIDPVLARVIRRHGPCRLRRNRGGFQTLAEIIVGQQLSTAVATAIFHRLRKLAGGRLTPVITLKLTDKQLRGVGLSRGKTTYIRDLARQTHQGKLALRRFHRMTDQEVIDNLTQVKGIGLWTAQMYLIFVLGRNDVFSSGDKGIQTAVTRLYGVARVSEMDAFAERWQPYRSIACWYLWRALENGPPKTTSREAARYTRE